MSVHLRVSKSHMARVLATATIAVPVPVVGSSVASAFDIPVTPTGRVFEVDVPFVFEGWWGGKGRLSLTKRPEKLSRYDVVFVCMDLQPRRIEGVADLSRWYLTCVSFAKKPGTWSGPVQGSMTLEQPDGTRRKHPIDFRVTIRYPSAKPVDPEAQKVGPVTWRQGCAVPGHDITLRAKFWAKGTRYPNGKIDSDTRVLKLSATGPVRRKSLRFRPGASINRAIMRGKTRSGEPIRCFFTMKVPL